MNFFSFGLKYEKLLSVVFLDWQKEVFEIQKTLRSVNILNKLTEITEAP